ncbi:MAG: DUF1236 domain-containing protein [Beijerinckiaceae bacterium]
MKNLVTTMFLASAMSVGIAAGAVGQVRPGSSDPACDATGMGSDPRCTGVVSRGDIRDLPAFRAYVLEQRHPAVSIPDVRVGAILPASGYTYYEVPARFGSTNLSYVVVDGRTVLLDRGTRRVVSIVE